MQYIFDDKLLEKSAMTINETDFIWYGITNKKQLQKTEKF